MSRYDEKEATNEVRNILCWLTAGENWGIFMWEKTIANCLDRDAAESLRFLKNKFQSR